MSAPGSDGRGWNGLSSSLGPSASQYLAESIEPHHADLVPVEANPPPAELNSNPVGGFDAGFEETPGRPSESVSEFADAYVQMMNDREAGLGLRNSGANLGSDGAEGLGRRTSPSESSLASSASQPSQAALPPLLAPPNSLSTSQSRSTPASPPQASAPLGFGPSHVSSASSSGSSRPEIISHPLGASVGVPSSSRARPSRPSHRRRASHGGALMEEYELEETSDSDEYDDYDDGNMESAPRSRRESSRGMAQPKSNGRPSVVPSAAPSSLSAASAQRNSSQRHARQNSTSSTRSGNSDPATRTYSRVSRAYNGAPLGSPLNPSPSSSSNGAPRSDVVSPLQHSQATIQMQKTRSTLFYIRRRIHCMRAASIFMLLVMSTLSLVPYIKLAVLLSESQANRNACQSPLTPSLTSPAIPIAASEPCFYFQHDMTSFLVVSGLWMGLAFGVSVMCVAASFMFYWRRFMRITLVSSITMCFVTVIVMTWAIVLLAFSWEWENWRGDGNEMNRSFSHHTRSNALKESSLVFLIAVCVFWVLNFIVSVISVHLSKFIMSKPRYCCWPLECGSTTRTKPSMPGYGVKHNGLEGPYALSASDSHRDRVGPAQLDTDEEEDLPDAGISIKPVPVKRKSDGDPTPQNKGKQATSSNASQTPAQDLTPLLNALQGIQSTVHSLAAKVQAIEDKEATSSTTVDLNDPFAYGRRF